jgi:hypothetical protein
VLGRPARTILTRRGPGVPRPTRRWRDRSARTSTAPRRAAGRGAWSRDAGPVNTTARHAAVAPWTSGSRAVTARRRCSTVSQPRCHRRPHGQWPPQRVSSKEPRPAAGPS